MEESEKQKFLLAFKESVEDMKYINQKSIRWVELEIYDVCNLIDYMSHAITNLAEFAIEILKEDIDG